MFKAATDRRGLSTQRGDKRIEPAASSVETTRRDEALLIKLDPDAIRSIRGERPGMDEDPERWDGLS